MINNTLPQWLINIAALESFRLEPGRPAQNGGLGTAKMYCTICNGRVENIEVPNFDSYTIERFMFIVHDRRTRHRLRGRCGLLYPRLTP